VPDVSPETVSDVVEESIVYTGDDEVYAHVEETLLDEPDDVFEDFVSEEAVVEEESLSESLERLSHPTKRATLAATSKAPRIFFIKKYLQKCKNETPYFFLSISTMTRKP
jgi:hypothetical protein